MLYVKSKKPLTQNILEIRNTMKRPIFFQRNRNRGRRETQLNAPEIINKIIEDNFLNLKKEIPINVQEESETQNRLD